MFSGVRFMSKSLLDRLYVCNLFQVKASKGYVRKEDLHSKYGIINASVMSHCYELGSIIVKKSIIFPYSLEEVITGISFDTIYEVYNPYERCAWYEYTVKGGKKEYDTFILVLRNPTKKDIDDYYSLHSDAEEYKSELMSLISSGKNNHLSVKNDEKEKKSAENDYIYRKVFSRKS